MAYGERFSRQRPRDAASSSRVPNVARKHPDRCPPPWGESQDGGQVAEARDGLRCVDYPMISMSWLAGWR